MESRQQEQDKQSKDLYCSRVKFLWAQRLSSLFSKLSFNINREICSYLGDFIPHVLPGIQGNNLRLYDLSGGEIKQATLSQSLSVGTMYCVIDQETVLCIGGGWPEVQGVYSLSLSNYQLIQLPSMSLARSLPGLHRHGNAIYIFGGNYPSIANCEKYNLTSKSWQVLPNMNHPRHAFSPSEYQGEVYLPDTFQSHKVLETFNLASEQFKILPILLSSFSQGNSVSFIVDGELVIITHTKQIGRWRIQSAEKNFRMSPIEIPVGNPLSNCPPVFVRREVFWVHYRTGSLMKFDLTTQKITQ